MAVHRAWCGNTTPLLIPTIPPPWHVAASTTVALCCQATWLSPQLLTVALGGHLSQFIAKGKLVTVSCFGLFFAGALIAVCQSYAGLVVGCAVLGLAAGLIESTANALLSDLFEGPKRTAAINYAHVAFAAGAIGIPLAMAVIIKNDVTWRAGFWLAASAGFIGAAWMIISGTWRLGRPMRFQMSSRGALDSFSLLLCAAMFCYVAAELGLCYWLPIHFRSVLHSGEAFAAASNSVFWTGAILGRLTAGYLGSRFKDVQMLRWSATCGLLTMLVFATLRSPTIAIVLVALMGLSFACIWPTIVAYAGHVYGPALGVRLPWIIAGGVVGSGVGPWLSGELASNPHIGQATAFLINPAFFTIILLILVVSPSAERSAAAIAQA